MNIENIRNSIKKKKIITGYHSRKRIVERKVYYDEILEVILHGEVLEEYVEAKPYPACLIMGFVRGDEPLYVVCAQNPESKYVYIITVHWQDPKKWKDPWTRKK